jgi:hypothetical protein
VPNPRAGIAPDPPARGILVVRSVSGFAMPVLLDWTDETP